MKFTEAKRIVLALKELRMLLFRLYRKTQKRVALISPIVLFYASLLSIIVLIADLGFDNGEKQIWFDRAYLIYFWIIFLSYTMQIIFREQKRRNLYFLLGNIFFMSYLALLLLVFPPFNIKALKAFGQVEYTHVGIIILFVVEFSKKSLDLDKLRINPALLLVFSFALIIVTGTGLLMLPEATKNGISFFEALFTSTSVVCVTGLMIVDLPETFTRFGHTVILILFQAGGLGIMTFTTFFGFFFSGSSSFYNQFMMKDFLAAQKADEVFKNLIKIVLFTFGMEAIAALLIFYSVDSNLFPNTSDHIFFSIFHGVSAFCNAGISTLQEGFHHLDYRTNFNLHLIVAFFFIIGGLGFPVVLNLYFYLKEWLRASIKAIRSKQQLPSLPRVINLHTKLVVYTSGLLLLAGFIFFFIAEYNNILKEYSWYGKIVTTIFLSSSPRTAGFNTFDLSQLSFHSIMIIFLLMWIGASPGSTGGGIKTTTFAVGTLNLFSLGRGKDRVEIFQREISNQSIRRAFAIISLSLIVMGFSTFGITYFDPQFDLMQIAFECFAAYSTTGFSFGITPDLSMPSKIILMLTMFTGRVGMLTIMIGVLQKIKTDHYRYPSSDIFIN
ncbi:MAG TPA: potassium transporter TrkG [Cyclobacteriaceae bacterium]|nr:potassium transporter TrkG [Cyclobacteriaceae bacterium]